MHTLAQATGAAQETELVALAGAGAPVTRQALFEAGLPASNQLHRRLYAGAESGAASADFAAGLQRALSGLVGAERNAQAQVASAIAFGSIIEQLAERFEDIDGVLDAILISAVAPLGLAGLVEALDEIMDPLIDQVFEELEALLDGFDLGSVSGGSMGDLIGTVTGLLDGVMGGGGILGGLPILGDLLGGNLLEEALELAEVRQGELEGAVSTAAAAAAGTGQCMDFGAMAIAVVHATTEFSADLQDGVADLAGAEPGDPIAGQLASVAEVLALFEGLLSVLP